MIIKGWHGQADGYRVTWHRAAGEGDFAQLSPVSASLTKTCLGILKRISVVQPLRGIMHLAHRLP